MRQHAHKLMITKTGFEIAVDKANYLVIARQSQIAGNFQGHVRVWAHKPCIDSFMNHADQILPDLWVNCELESCRGDPGRRHINMQRYVEISKPQMLGCGLLFSNRKLWVKALCCEGILTVPFAIQPYARLWARYLAKTSAHPSQDVPKSHWARTPAPSVVSPH